MKVVFMSAMLALCAFFTACDAPQSSAVALLEPVGPEGMQKFDGKSHSGKYFVFYEHTLDIRQPTVYRFLFLGNTKDALIKKEKEVRAQLAEAGFVLDTTRGSFWWFITDTKNLGRNVCVELLEATTDMGFVAVSNYTPDQNGFFSDFHKGPWIITVPTDERGKVDLKKKGWTARTVFTGIRASVIQNTDTPEDAVRVRVQWRNSGLLFWMKDGKLEPSGVEFQTLVGTSVMPSVEKENLAKLIEPYMEDLPTALKKHFSEQVIIELQKLSQDKKLHGKVSEGEK